MATQSHSFPIGFRRGGGDWQKDIVALASWAKAGGFAAIDLGHATARDVNALATSGLKLGSVDLLQFDQITHADAGKRKEVIAANVAYVKEAAALGAKVFFTIVAGEANKSRAENYRIAVESFAPIAEAAAGVGGAIAVEGYPGNPPHYTLLCTTPETCRAFLKDIPRGAALNYDPSHLIRLGVDHVRFLKEFLPHVVHVHGKDTLLLSDALYEFGYYQPSAFQKAHRFGENVWRYTIPGRGVARWDEIYRTLGSAGYKGMICVELEDEDFNGSEDGERRGFLESLKFLRGVA